MPHNTVKVARPGIWGNPFAVAPGREAKICVALYRAAMVGDWPPRDTSMSLDEELAALHAAWLARFERQGGTPLQLVLTLKGRNLACFCGLDQPCHADVLLHLANAD